MKILVTGDRNWTNEKRMREVILGIEENLYYYNHPGELDTLFFIHGGARGADRLAGKIATEAGWTVKVVTANWEKYGRAAGPIRNQEMLDMNPDLVIAFHDDLANSKGTKDMVNRAKKKGVKVILISSKE